MSPKHDLDIYKYPRTQHIEGSRLQPGDEDLDSVPFHAIANRHIVVEEKVDGANAAISFSVTGEPLLQSRGHYLTGGGRERHFALFKQWAYTHAMNLQPILGSRYIMYGEWLYAKHTVFYDQLPHYFMEFDILDKEENIFLDTPRRREMLDGLPIVPVKVLASDSMGKVEQMTGLMGRSHFIGDDHVACLDGLCQEKGIDVKQVLSETDLNQDMEGLYIKVEEGGVVQERYKFVRPSFFTTMMQSGSHWLSRPIIPNQLAAGVDIFASEIG